jgi:hypothetical protein
MNTLNRSLGLALAAVLLQPCLGFAQAASGADQPASAAAASSSAAAPAAMAPPSAAPVSPPAAAAASSALSQAPAQSGAPASEAPALSGAPLSQPPTAAAAPAAPPAVAMQPRIPVALVITPDLKAIVWTKTPELLRPMYQVGDVNDLGQATEDACVDLLKTMALDVHVVASPDEAQTVSGARYFLVPTIQRYEEHNQGLTTFAPFVETIVVQWKVTDAKGNTVLLDTVLATATGKLGNNFISATRAENIEDKMLADLKTKSTALLQPVLIIQ